MPSTPSRYERILELLDRLLQPLYSPRVRRAAQQSLPYWISSLLVGLAAVSYEMAFSWAEALSFRWIKAVPVLAFAITPLAFVWAWALVQRFAPAARGSGIPQVMAGIELSTPFRQHSVGYLLSLKVVIVKVISSIILLLGGGVIGREGPTIQISAAIFRAINRLQPKGWPQLSRQIALVTGGAAGLAAAFNTPLGGIVFVVEELTQLHLSRFRMAVFTAVIVAGLTAQGILGPYLYLGIPMVKAPYGQLMLLMAATALCAGVAGALFSKTLLALNTLRRRLAKGRTYFWIWPLGCGLAMAAIAFLVGINGMGTGKPLINTLLFFNTGNTPWYLFPIRFIGMALSYGSGAAGGVFATSLSAGALLGDLAGQLAQIPVEDRNLLILVSMVSFLTGVVRSPFTAAILVLEMTDRHGVIFQLLAAGLLAQLSASWIDRHSLYEHLRIGFLQEALHNAKTETVVK